MLSKWNFSQVLSSMDKQIENLLSSMNSEMDRFFGPELRVWKETEIGYELRVEIPGFTKEDLKIEIDSESESLMVEGSKKDQADRFVNQSTFKYSYLLPKVTKIQTFTASVQNGVCLITVAADKKENKPRTIPITII